MRLRPINEGALVLISTHRDHTADCCGTIISLQRPASDKSPADH